MHSGLGTPLAVRRRRRRRGGRLRLKCVHGLNEGFYDNYSCLTDSDAGLIVTNPPCLCMCVCMCAIIDREVVGRLADPVNCLCTSDVEQKRNACLV